MKTGTFANQKDGVGKTALSTHCAFHAADQGYRVLFDDAAPAAAPHARHARAAPWHSAT
ncbi:hypothetical protein [Arhodomonas sp. AD133]|uniref:nucleotide-binding protein n=1 Tax=Arhodomonas sp. AD133 TaxID=3415009 RepID=UPI003EC00DFD